MRPIVAVLLPCVMLFGAVRPTPLRAQNVVTADQVRRAIDDGVVFLRGQQLNDGSWPAPPLLVSYAGGVTSLCTLALLNAGVPVNDPMIQKALTNLRKLEATQTYVVALQTMVFCLADPQRDLLLIRRNVAYLEAIQKNEGGTGTWTYSGNAPGSGDNSNAQFALLALHEAERIGVTTSRQTWTLAKRHWETTQNPDGSWGYLPRRSGTGSMTCAGIASLIMATEKLDDGDIQVDGDQVHCCGEPSPNDKIERGLQWLTDFFTVKGNINDSQHYLYYLYGLERVGRLTNRRLFAQHDWYREGAYELIKPQQELANAFGRGSWRGIGQGEKEPVVGTSLALLFLSKGRRPVLAAKLNFGPGNDWNRHRQDLANLVYYCERQWRRELTWQVIEMRRAKAADLIQAPVLFISGSSKPEFSDDEAAELRNYLDMGGFIFAEACCGSTAFDEGFRALMARVFPERDDGGRPLYALRELPPDHSVWRAEKPVEAKHIRPLYGIDVGCRTSVIYCGDFDRENLGCLWALNRVGRKQTYSPAVEDKIQGALTIGINVMAYATNREVPFKLETPTVVADAGPKEKIERAKLYLAEVKHSGGSGVAPAALVNLLKQLALDTNLHVSAEKRELALTQDSLFDYHLVFMHGRQAFTLSDAERKQLRLFIERGGMLFADSVCSSAEFTESFRREMNAVFPEIPLRPIPAKSPIFTDEFGGFDLSQVTLRDPRRVDDAGPLRADVLRVAPELEGLQLGERYGVIFSKYDLSCALERQNSLECTGYARDDAAKIAINIVLFSLRGNL